MREHPTAPLIFCGGGFFLFVVLLAKDLAGCGEEAVLVAVNCKVSWKTRKRFFTFVSLDELNMIERIEEADSTKATE
jgi:hypothetical protein